MQLQRLEDLKEIGGALLFLIAIVVVLAGIPTAVVLLGNADSSVHDIKRVGLVPHSVRTRTSSTSHTTGLPFRAKVDFRDFRDCGHPCRLPLLTKPGVAENQAVNGSNFPCEGHDPTSLASGPYCLRGKPGPDKVMVGCQVRGPVVFGDSGTPSSDIWDKVAVPARFVKQRFRHQLARVPHRHQYYAYGADRWLGNREWNRIPCSG